MKIFLLLKTVLAYLLLGILCTILIPPLFLIACLPEKYRYDNRVFFFILDLLFKLSCRATLCPVRIIGKENLPTGPAIFIPNHQSTLDIPLVGSLCGGNSHVWLVLEYYVSTPILGFFITRMCVAVDRKNPIKAARSLIKILKFIQDKNRHLILFPEGGRFIDGKVHEFFEGFAIIARKTNRPVIPVFMPNNRKIYPPGSFYVHSYPLIAIIGKPLSITQDETEKEFMQRVRNWFIEQQDAYL
ncbi:1-acyl-sn-glycerol-3-phosphate acyltransferase [Candidatus Dependentiae bacterium]|nr:1-acyl-sn-glycerol-3-phosphate acyltransferase [Candidatus Dependentiae bacterium]